MPYFPETQMLTHYYDMGGFVMPALAVVAVCLWYALTKRLFSVKASKKGPRELIKLAKIAGLAKDESVTARAAIMAVEVSLSVDTRAKLKSVLNERFADLMTEVNAYRTMVRVLVMVSPLLGLLGTIDGMIETFKSLGDMALFSQSGGIAGGISRALFTTQVGLAISIPGLMIGRMLERRQQNIVCELDQIKDLVWVYTKKKPENDVGQTSVGEK